MPRHDQVHIPDSPHDPMLERECGGPNFLFDILRDAPTHHEDKIAIARAVRWAHSNAGMSQSLTLFIGQHYLDALDHLLAT